MKKILSLMMVLMMMVLLLAGCNNASGVTTVPATQPSKPVATTPVATTPVVTTPAPTEPEDELEILKVSSGYASAQGGIYLKRGENLYVISDQFVPRISGAKYNVGLVWNDRVSLYYEQDPLSPPFGSSVGIFSCGEVPVPVIEDNDLVVGYFTSEPFTMSLRKVSFYGYTIPVMFDGSNGGIWNEGVDGIRAVVSGDPAKLTFEDKNGSTPSDPRNLVYGDAYKVSWFAGTQYNELEMAANCSYYKFVNWDEKFVLSGTLTKNGYCTFDLSELKPGFYALSGGWVIEVR